MRLIKSKIANKDGAGFVTLSPEEPEDMWHAYNLIQPTDLLRATAVRKVNIESGEGGKRRSEKVKVVITIEVTKLDFDPQAGQLHVSGRVAVQNPVVKLGQYHTLDLELHRNFTLEKPEGWDRIAIMTLKGAINETKRAVLWAVVMQEGLAHICLVTDHQTILRQKVTTTLPKKRAGSNDHDKGLQRFFQTTLDTLMRQLDHEDLKPILLASPAFTANSFFNFIKTQASSGKDRLVKNIVPQLVVTHSATGHMHSLAEVLSNPNIMKKLVDTQFSRESELMDKFFEMIRKDDGRAWYGPKECEAAVAKGAVGKGGGVLMISNALFRAQDVAIRKRWVAVVDEVANAGGEVRVLSSMHESGKRLEGLGGIAVILTYPIDDLDEEGSDEGAEQQDDISQPEPNANGPSNGIEGRSGHAEETDFL